MSKKRWINHNGMEVPANYVHKEDKERERIVMKHVNMALWLNVKLAEFKEQMLNDCDSFFEALLLANKVKSNHKGNYTLTSFDKSIKIEVNIQNKVEFDDRVQIAHAKIREYLVEITKDSNHDLALIVNSAFETTKGKLDVKRVLGLFELNIKHPTWIDAMELIKNSISHNNSKRYVRVWQKDDNGEYRNIDLNFSSI